jgi:hypothetical protein
MTTETPQKLPVDVQSFKVMREENYKYVDKTHLVYQLAHGSARNFFLSRPRRFGKSLLISTIEEYFKGNHELFRGLAADQLESPESDGGWKKHIVFHFDFAGGDFESNGIKTLHSRIDKT